MEKHYFLQHILIPWTYFRYGLRALQYVEYGIKVSHDPFAFGESCLQFVKTNKQQQQKCNICEAQ